MAKRSRIQLQPVDDEFVLPEPLIQHIQSFMTRKEAAQTIVLAKPWYNAWLTRPNLELDLKDYRIGDLPILDHTRFHRFATKTMERYEQLNLKFESLKLYMNNLNLGREIIVKAMEMRAVDLDFDTALSTFVLPNEVLESPDLIRLSVTGCKLDGKTTWSSLESLSLTRVCIVGDRICDIIFSCPTIEQLVLSECKFVVKSVSPGNSVTSSTRMLALDNSLINLYEFRKLKRLFLGMVKLSSLFFNNFSYRFPFLEDLSVHNCFGYKDIQIHSASLEYISFEHKQILRAKFDVPRIRMFKFTGSHVPSLSFERASSEWQSEIYITWANYKTSWFLKLNKFLGQLRQSEISLFLVIGYMLEEIIGNFPKNGGLPKPVVERLSIVAMTSSASSSLMDGLFWCFHPKHIHLMWMPKDKGNNNLIELLCKTLIQEGSEDRCIIPNRIRFALQDLEEVSVHGFDGRLGVYRPLSWKMLLDASASPNDQRRIFFRLQWAI